MSVRRLPCARLALSMTVFAACCALASPASAADIAGAGSTFVYPMLAKWADAYQTASGMAVNYQAIGSGGGIKQIQGKTVDFGASDAPLTPEELDKGGLVQFPVVIGGDGAGDQPRRVSRRRAETDRPSCSPNLSRQDQEMERPASRALNPA